MDFDAEAIFHKLTESGEDWADKDSAANLLEQNKNILLADLELDAPADTEKARERFARAHASYKEHIAVMITARREANKAKVKYECLRVLAELRRTEASTRRAEMMLR